MESPLPIPDLAGACFEAGRRLAPLTPAACRGAPQQGVWIDRLALRAAAACLAFGGRREDEAGLRDAVLFTRPGDDAGPAGRVLAFWRRMAARTPGLVGADDLAGEAAPLTRGQQALSAAFAEALAASDRAPPVAAAAAAALLHRVCPNQPAIVLAAADLVLARRMGWPRLVPLLAQGLGRRPRPEAGDWPAVCAAAYAAAAARAESLHAELGRRAAGLLGVEKRLRARGAGAVVAALLAGDALSGSAVRTRVASGTSDRAARRLLERLTTLGVVRELTGRSTHRLYGL